MPDATTPADPKAAAASPLAWPLAMLDGTGRVYTSLQLGATPARPGAPVYRTVTKTNISSWTF